VRPHARDRRRFRDAPQEDDAEVRITGRMAGK